MDYPKPNVEVSDKDKEEMLIMLDKMQRMINVISNELHSRQQLQQAEIKHLESKLDILEQRFNIYAPGL